MQNLRQYCRIKFKSVFESVTKQTNASTFILITDDVTLKLLSNVMKMTQLVGCGVSSIEKITLKRKKFHKIQAVYVLAEIANSLPMLLQDYGTQEQAQYSCVHLFFTRKVSTAAMDAIIANPVLVKRIKSFKEFNLEFVPVTKTEYELSLQHSMPNLKRWLYTQTQQIKAIERLLTLLTTFPRFYTIEILYPRTQSRIAERIAKGLYERLSEVVKQLMKANSSNIDRKAGKINLFIFDRTFDPVSPLIRDFHYASMLADLKDVTRFQVQFSDGKNPSKMMQLDQNDVVYKKYRYTHIAKVLEGLPSDFQEFAESNSTAKFQTGQSDNLSTGKLAEIMKSIPKYTEMKEKYSLHTQLVQDLMKIYKEKQLEVIGELEQSIVTGVGSELKRINDRMFLENIINVLNKEKSNTTKARIIVLALMCLEIKQKEKAYLGDILKSLGPGFGGLYAASQAMTSQKPMKLRQNAPKGNLILDRYIPRVESTVGQFVINRSKGDLGCLRINNDDRGLDKPLGRVRNKFREEEEVVLQLDKLVVYMAGGLGFNEIRCLNKFSNQYSIITGSDCIVSPREYLETLKILGSKQPL